MRDQGEENTKVNDWCPLELKSPHSTEEDGQEPEYSAPEKSCEKRMQAQRREWLPTFTLETKAVSCWRITKDSTANGVLKGD